VVVVATGAWLLLAEVAVKNGMVDTASMLREFCNPLEVWKKRWKTMNEQK